MGGAGLTEPAIILMGLNDADYLGAGWFPVHAGPAGIPCRWTRPAAEIRLPDFPLGKEILLTVSTPPSTSIKAGMSFYQNDELNGHAAGLNADGFWVTVRVPLVRCRPSCPVLLAVENRDSGTRVPVSFVPHNHLHNGDFRELGILVSTIRFA